MPEKSQNTEHDVPTVLGVDPFVDPDGLHVIRVNAVGNKGVDVYGKRSLTDDCWVYKGMMVGNANASFAGFTATNESYFAKVDNSSADTDSDGIVDAAESGVYGTNPNSAYSSGDILTDWEKIFRWGLNPLKKDTDFDGYDDVEEILMGTNPLVPDAAAATSIRYSYDADDRLIGAFYGGDGGGETIKLSPAGNPEFINVRSGK